MNMLSTSVNECFSGRVANTTRSAEIAKVLLDEILRGQFRVGERLPSERDLAARFRSGRGAVREALSQIEQLRLIEINPGGARIKSVRDSSIAVLGPLLALDESPNALLVDQFLETFSVLTQLSGRRAISAMSTDQQHALLKRLEEMTDRFATGFQLYCRVPEQGCAQRGRVHPAAAGEMQAALVNLHARDLTGLIGGNGINHAAL